MSVSVEVMHASDNAAINVSSGKILMHKAGEALAECIKNACRENGFNKIIFMNGKGNNGGDGYVAAAILCLAGYGVGVFADIPQTEECYYYANQYHDVLLLRNDDGKTKYTNCFIKNLSEFDKFLNENSIEAVLVDCLLGTGIKGDLRAEYATVVKALNTITTADKRVACKMNTKIKSKRKNYVISCDMPSGLCDNGRTKCAVIADKTLAIACDKDAYYLNDGKDYTGIIEIADVGIKIIGETHRLTDASLLEEMFPPRKKNSHKGNYGSVGIVACSENYAGAGKLSLVAAINTLGECAMRSGAGLTRLYVPDIMKPYMWSAVEACSIGSTNDLLTYGANAFIFGIANHSESVTINDSTLPLKGIDLYNNNDQVMKKRIVESQNGILKESVFAYGMGIGKGDVAILRQLINIDSILIIDADGINLLSNEMQLLRDKADDKIVILTPHVKEMSRLCGKTVEAILDDPINTAQRFAAEYGVIMLLKGSASIITDGKETYINANGSPCLAKGGSGDLLSGIIAALAAKGIKPLKAAACGAFILGEASEIAASKYGENSTLPQDIAAAIKKIICR